jgi:hypothetical protein
MAERIEVVSIVDYNSGLSWRMNCEEVRYWFKRLGVEEAKRQMHEQLSRALEIEEDAVKGKGESK